MQHTFTTPAGQTCVFGRVALFQTGLLGAVNGTVTPLIGQPIPFTQVVGPAGGPVSLQSLDGQFALICGNFVQQNGGVALRVTVVTPFAAGGAAVAVATPRRGG